MRAVKNQSAKRVLIVVLLWLWTFPLAAEPIGAGVFSGIVNLLALLLPVSILLLSVFPLIFLRRRLSQGVDAASRRAVFVTAIVIWVLFSALTAGAAVLAVDLATPKEIDMGSEFVMTEVSWGFVISAALSALIAFVPVVQAVRMIRFLHKVNS